MTEHGRGSRRSLHIGAEEKAGGGELAATVRNLERDDNGSFYKYMLMLI